MEMIFEKQLKIYELINFCNRYENLSKKHQFEYTFEKYSKDTVIKIIEDFNYNVAYVKNGNFFKIEEKKNKIKFYFNISLKYGFTELIIGATSIILNKFLLGGPFGAIYKDITYAKNGIEERVNLPSFRTYEDLQEILKEAFSIYEDFKREVIKEYSKGE